MKLTAKSWRALVRTNAVIDNRRHYRRQRIADYNNPHPISEGRPQNILSP